ncbi:hypothetical protein Har1130_18910 [Haloarcula sp. CBA1130]|uniref:hypothetical protein n=1 Tax=unclassified Haloarcula TaxID=2624677 RepID=UPI001245313C|nr:MULTISPECIES: hypothetical protein [unclassified Haloarcula]KAA9396352.1 hypothetical protein Har1130_18910 [Haloarcula sp. CBA1130]KAA9397476.1 hypothetical protein Har1129_04105 [Haloarcula sp. CBA1129]
MHKIIYAIVEASTEDEAVTAGKQAFDHLVGVRPHSSAVFDYYVTFDDETTSVAGKARWGDRPTAAPIDSADGQELLDRGWEATKAEFERNLKRVKDALNEHSDEEIMRDKDLARHAFRQVGASRGSAIALYTEHGDGICDRTQLDRILGESDSLWIVPADVHL